MPLSWNEIRQNAIRFSREWSDEGREVAEAKSFWDEDPINIRAVEILGDLHDALAAGGYAGHDLERFLVRILFCLFADDTGLFEPDSFRLYIENRTAADGSDLGLHLAQLFEVLNTPPGSRQAHLDEMLAAFPYVNGELFKERLAFAAFNRAMRDALVKCTEFDWSAISPAIFGSLFQGVMEPAERRQTGEHRIATSKEKTMTYLSASIFKKAPWKAIRQAAMLFCLGTLALAPLRLAAQGCRYIDITTTGYAGSAPLTNFPLLVRLSTDITNFSYTMCQPGGADLVFQDAAHNTLPHEIDTWDTNGTSLVWVCVPELTASTTLRLYFSDPGATTPPAYTTDGSTWSPANFRGVWHFASLSDGVTPDSSASRLDSTANDPAVSTGRVDGIIGNCVFNSDGPEGNPAGKDGKGFLTTNYTGLTSAAHTFTISGWCRHRTSPTITGSERIFSRKAHWQQ